MLRLIIFLFFLLNSASTFLLCQNEPINDSNCRFPSDFDNFQNPAAWIGRDTAKTPGFMWMEDGQLIFGKGSVGPWTPNPTQYKYLYRHLEYGMATSVAWRLEFRVHVLDRSSPFRFTIGLSSCDSAVDNQNISFRESGIFITINLSRNDSFPMVQSWAFSSSPSTQMIPAIAPSVYSDYSSPLKLTSSTSSYYLSLEQLSPNIGRLWVYTDESKCTVFAGSPVYFNVGSGVKEMNVIEVYGESESHSFSCALDELRFFNRGVVQVTDPEIPSRWSEMINSFRNKQAVSFSPNPCEGSCIIDFLKDPGEYTADLYDLKGQKLTSLSAKQNPLTFTFPDCGPGIYLLYLRTERGLFVKRIVRM
jgi:hypothetical protein